MLREHRGGGVEEGSTVFYVENSGVRCVVQVCQLRLQHQMEPTHLKDACNYCIQYMYVKQSISGFLSYCGKTKKQTDQSNLPYSVTFRYSLQLIGKFGFSFSAMVQAT